MATKGWSQSLDQSGSGTMTLNIYVPQNVEVTSIRAGLTSVSTPPTLVRLVILSGVTPSLNDTVFVREGLIMSDASNGLGISFDVPNIKSKDENFQLQVQARFYELRSTTTIVNFSVHGEYIG